MQDESLTKRYHVSFVREGREFEFEAEDDAMSEARAWSHVARHLHIPTHDLRGFQKRYHTIRRHVEAHNVQDVSFRAMGAGD
ncbi:hypothetical protein IB274_07285 [Pseudomonas sp. PDM18]|uniref:hypothetical protein n=1 Tax=unclassified Pseudomonas TaxID=196821 RepID=UPI0017813056|nr:hypothetical protein [Pseudomonas sp. PDM18]MBD9676496.1 hypothetical protein [Pseudomonas sp. PDM18]MDF3865359.1 hypothetical protein [Pseudomonas denitrificans (nom. rej.)]